MTLTFEMLDMQMGYQEYQMTETSPGVYTHSAPALVMAGRWGLLFTVTPKAGLAVHRPRSWTTRRMSGVRVRLLASFAALAAGAVAVAVVLDLLHTTLG